MGFLRNRNDISTSKRARERRRTRRTGRPQVRQRTFEQLEDRRLLVIGAGAFAATVPRGDDFDGVVNLFGCTGSLMSTGRHILTAAHCIDDDGTSGTHGADSSLNVRFEMARNGNDINVDFTIPAADIAVEPNWDGGSGGGNDLAIGTLTDGASDRHLIAPFGAQRYALFTGAPVGMNFTQVGYGETGTGNTGQQSNEVQRVSITNPSGGTFTLTFGGQTTGAIAENADSDVVAAALQQLTAIQNLNPNSGRDVVVNTVGLPANTWDVRFFGTGADVAQLTGTGSGGSSVNVSTIFDGGTGSGGTKRRGENTYDEFRLANRSLAFDFDNGQAAQNALGGTGLGAVEGFGSRGDSGGPGFIRNTTLNTWEIATVVSFTDAQPSPPDINNYVTSTNAIQRDNSFGEVNVDTFANAYAGTYINPTLMGDHDLVLDMSQQPHSMDGVTDDLQIIVRREGAELVIQMVNLSSPGVFEGVHREQFAEVRSLTILGDVDNESVVVDFNGGNPVPDGGIDFDGGAGDDQLIVQGNDQYQVTSRPSGTQDRTGEIIVGVDHSITYTGLEPVIISRTPVVTFITGGSVDDLVIASPSPQATTITGNSDAVIIEDHILYNVGRLIVDARANDLGGDDRIVIDRPVGVGVPGVVEESEANNTPGAADFIPNGASGAAEINPGTDEDWWQNFDASAGDLIFSYVNARQSTTDVDSTLEVYAGDGTTLIERDDDDGGPGFGNSVVAGAVVPSGGGGIFYRVESFLNTDTLTPYRIYQSVVDPLDSADEVEGNDSAAAATPITATMMTGHADGESDFYSFYAPAGAEIVLMLDADPEDDGVSTGTILSLLDTDGSTVLASNTETGNGNALGPIVAATSGTYYVQVQGNGGTNGSYRFVTSVSDPQPNAPRNLNNVDALSGAGEDKFFVTPAAFVLTGTLFQFPADINIQGDGPVASPGDVLAVDLRGVTNPQVPSAPTANGIVNSNSHASVNYFGIEHLIATDAEESNDSIEAASVLGSVPELTLNDLTIDTMDDQDYFQITANRTGKLIINAFFEDVAGSMLGNVDIEVLDQGGNQIAISNSTTSNEQIVIPVVAQESYFLHVYTTDDMPNVYDLEIENIAAPVPGTIHLDPASDTGMLSNDHLTADNTPRFVIHADLSDFEAMGIPLDPAAGDPGADVVVEITGLNTGTLVIGNASRLGSTNLWTFTPATPLPDDVYFAAAAVQITDGQGTPVVGRSLLSESLWFTIDTAGPKGMVLQTFTADLTGGQEVPPVTTLAGGSARLVLNPASDRLEITIELVGLDLDGQQTPNNPNDDVLGLHIHRGAAGVNGPVVFGLINPNSDTNGDLVIDAASGRISSVWNLNEGNGTTLAAELANLLAGNLYINVHTPANTGGEVRGQILAAGGALQLLQSSETGMSVIDGVTSKMSPAFLVKGEANAKVRIMARNVLTGGVSQVGSGVVGSDATDGVAGNGFGYAEVTVEPMADGSYEFWAVFEDLAGNVSRHYDFAAQGLPVAIPDLSSVDVPIDVAHLFGNITDIDVKFDIAHSSVVDLTLQLISPSGTTVTLFSNIDGTADNLFGTILDDSAATTIDTGSAPFTGRFRLEPTALLSTFNGEDPNGTWTLRVIDGIGDDTGTVLSVHLCIQTDGGLPVEIDSVAPNTAFLDLVESSDSGRHNDDNVTNDNTPAVTMTTEDPNSHFHVGFTDNLKFRIYDRFEGSEEFLLYDSAWDGAVDAVATPGDAFTRLQLILETLPQQYFANAGSGPAAITAAGELADGLHNLKLEVEDRAGNISHDFLLDLLIDTQAYRGDVHLHPESDSGVDGYAATMTDLITSDKVPQFFGVAEANNIVTLAIDGVAAGTAVAVPLDGDDAFRPPTAPNAHVEANWDIQTVLNLLDGEHSAVATFEDLAGNRISTDPYLFFVDTQGPRVENVTFNDDTTTDIFDTKPDALAPDPLVHSLVIHYTDAPDRTNNFLYDPVFQALAQDPGNYLLVGDANGAILITEVQQVSVNPGPGTATAQYRLVFAEPLPDDRFTLTISDNIQDVVGNALDGESTLIAPGGVFPSGDGSPGGDFVARFTVDSRAEIGVWAAGTVWIDTNGNFMHDPENPDDTNEDITYVLGFPTDNVFAGNFSDTAGSTADGFDKLGAYGMVAGQFRWLIDTDNDGVPNIIQANTPSVNALPVAGNFDGVAENGDEVGLFNGSTWFLDTNHDFRTDTQLQNSNMTGFPIVGDFDGDGTDDLGTFADDTFQLDLSADGIDGQVDLEFEFDFTGVRERPFAADFDGDGIDDLGLWVPDRSGATPEEISEWYILVSNGLSITDRVRPNPDIGRSGLIVDFIPKPFGPDIYAAFGDEFALPVVGNLDPPIVPTDTPRLTTLSFTNPVDPTDIDRDGITSPRDVLQVINYLNTTGSHALPRITVAEGTTLTDGPLMDSNADLVISPADVLRIIIKINQQDGSRGGEGEGEDAGVGLIVSGFDSLEMGFEPVSARAPADSPTAAIVPDVPAGSSFLREPLLALEDSGRRDEPLEDVILAASETLRTTSVRRTALAFREAAPISADDHEPDADWFEDLAADVDQAWQRG